MITGAIAMAAAILLAFLRLPLAFALLAVSVLGLGLVVNWTVAFQLVPLTISDAVLSYDIAVVPMFILMGNVISRSGIAQDLFRAAHAFVDHVRGGWRCPPGWPVQAFRPSAGPATRPPPPWPRSPIRA